MWSDYDFRLPDGNITIDEMANKLNKMLKELVNQHAPLQSKSITERTKVPWFDNEVKEYKWTARCREKTLKKIPYSRTVESIPGSKKNLS